MNKAPHQGQREDLISSLAETRARLAKAEQLLQIEESLDRIRARTMAMRSSEEMAELIALVFEELQRLGFDNQTCALAIIDPETHDSEVWRYSEVGTKTGQSYYVPQFDHPVYKNIIRGWHDQSSFIIIDLKEEVLQSYYSHLFKHTEYGSLPAERQKALLSTPQIVWTMVFMKHGSLAVVDYGLTARALDENRIAILRKVARTFDLTYTRLLDLQEAELSARKARQESSVNRIRAEIVSMQSTSDLNSISSMIWSELTSFDVPFIRCGIVLIDEGNSSMEIFLTRNDGTTFDPFTIPFQSIPTFPNAVAAWQQQEVYSDTWDKNEYDAWAGFLIEQGVMLPEDRDHFVEATLSGVNLTFIPFVYGHLYIGSENPLSEAQTTHLKILAEAFSVAFARYNDFKLLEAKNQELADAFNNLESTQSRLVQSEKLASLGKLTAGIAHEIKNPLNFVNNFAEISVELAEELEELMTSGEDVSLIVDDLKQNAHQITKHGRRAASIVNSMMQHASGSQGTRQKVELNIFIAEYINLAYHGMRARSSNFNTSITQEFDQQAGFVEVVPQEIGRVLINLFNNAFFAMQEKGKQEKVKQEKINQKKVKQRTTKTVDTPYKPELIVQTHRSGNSVEIHVIDNGPGISKKIADRVFEPFFTTKPAGSGTGLGLSLSFDIITQGHNGQLSLKSEPGVGTTFVIVLPALPESNTL